MEFDKHLKKVGGHIGRNVVEITIKMKTIVRNPLMIKILEPCQKKKKQQKTKTKQNRTKQKTVEPEGDGDTNCRWCAWDGPQKPGKRLEELEIRGRVEILQTTELLKSVIFFKKILETSVTQAPVKDHLLTLVGKCYIEYNNNNNNKEEKISSTWGFSVLADQRVTIKNSEKLDIYWLESWKICGTWKWRRYQLLLVSMEQLWKAWKKDWRNGKSYEDLRSSRPQHCWDWIEYSEGS